MLMMLSENDTNISRTRGIFAALFAQETERFRFQSYLQAILHVAASASPVFRNTSTIFNYCHCEEDGEMCFCVDGVVVDDEVDPDEGDFWIDVVDCPLVGVVTLPDPPEELVPIPEEPVTGPEEGDETAPLNPFIRSTFPFVSTS